MTKKNIIAIVTVVLAGLLIGWSSWVSNSTVMNRVAIAEVKAEVKAEFKGIANTLNMHYGLLKEIRDDQKRRARIVRKGE